MNAYRTLLCKFILGLMTASGLWGWTLPSLPTVGAANGDSDWWSQVKKNLIDWEYNVTEIDPDRSPGGVNSTHQAVNRSQNLRFYFSEAGLQAQNRTPETDEWRWSLIPVRVDYDGIEFDFPAIRNVAVEKNRIDFEGNPLTVYYLNDNSGLTQGFRWEREVASSSMSVAVELALGGSAIVAGVPEGAAIEFKDTLGTSKLRYRIEFAQDANGVLLPVRLLRSEEECGPMMRLEVETSGATWPITLEARMTSIVWVAESDQVGAQFGWAVAAAGDVNGDNYSDVLVSAPTYDGTVSDSGRVWLFLGSFAGLSTTASWTASVSVSGHCGYSISTAGDVNGDGFMDFIIGVPNADPPYVNVYKGAQSAAGAVFLAAIEGASGSEFGVSVSIAGDVNGDGYSDIIVGAPNHDGKGAAFVYHGSASGISTTANWSAVTSQAGARFGCSVACAGDIKYDGYSDVVVGAEAYDYLGRTDTGRVSIFYGSASGLEANANWSYYGEYDGDRCGASVASTGNIDPSKDDYIAVGLPGRDNFGNFLDSGLVWIFVSNGLYIIPSGYVQAIGGYYGTNHHFGQSIASAGDINGDGYADLIVGKPITSDSIYAGSALILYGRSSNEEPFDLINGVQGITNSTAGDQYGFSVCSAGDVNGDGYADIIVGAPSDENGEDSEGRAYLYMGSATGATGEAAWSSEGDQNQANYGDAIAVAGDVNGDGYDDALVGAPKFDGGYTDEGKVWLFTGSSSGLSDSAIWSASGGQASAYFGHSVGSAGDVNGDGYEDVIIGAYGYTVSTAQEGAAFVYYGSSSGLGAVADWTAHCGQANSLFGFSVASAGDLNSDGYSDVIVGAISYDAGPTTNMGRVFVYYGASSGLPPSYSTFINRDQANSFFGMALAGAGDVNRDGYDDVIISAPYYDYGQQDEGVVWLYIGSSSGLVDSAMWGEEGDQINGHFGWSLAPAGDINADGYADVIVGAPDYDNGETNEGSAFVYCGYSSGIYWAPDWTAESDREYSYLGFSVAPAGDVNNDGYSDIIVGEPWYDVTANGEEGRIYLYTGGSYTLSGPWRTIDGASVGGHFGQQTAGAGDFVNDGRADILVSAPDETRDSAYEGCAYMYYLNGTSGSGTDKKMRQLKVNNSPLALMGNSDSDTQVRLSIAGLTPFGTGRLKLELEVRPLGVSFSGANFVTAWTNITSVSYAFNELLTVSGGNRVKHWRMRLIYHPADFLYLKKSPWYTMPQKAINQGNFRLALSTPTPPPTQTPSPSPTCTMPPSETPVCTFTDTPTTAASSTATPPITSTPSPPSPTPLTTATPTCINDGDVNNDSEITAGDAQSAFAITLGMMTPTPEEYCSADCNADDDVTAGDAQQIFITAIGAGQCVQPLI